MIDLKEHKKNLKQAKKTDWFAYAVALKEYHEAWAIIKAYEKYKENEIGYKHMRELAIFRIKERLKNRDPNIDKAWYDELKACLKCLLKK